MFQVSSGRCAEDRWSWATVGFIYGNGRNRIWHAASRVLRSWSWTLLVVRTGAGCGVLNLAEFLDICAGGRGKLYNALSHFIVLYTVNFLRYNGHDPNAFMCNALKARTERFCESDCLGRVDGQAVVAF